MGSILVHLTAASVIVDSCYYELNTRIDTVYSIQQRKADHLRSDNKCEYRAAEVCFGVCMSVDLFVNLLLFTGIKQVG